MKCIKLCKRCNLEKPIEDFYKNKNNKRFSSYCKVCENERNNERRKNLTSEQKEKVKKSNIKFYYNNLENRKENNKKQREKIKESGLTNGQEYRIKSFGILPEDYINMLNIQQNKCAICGNYETAKSGPNKTTKRLAIDHCHETGKVRELLCHQCNNGLGCFRDNIENMKKAIEYLEKHKNIE